MQLSLLRQGLTEPEFYGDFKYKLKKIVGSNNFSAVYVSCLSCFLVCSMQPCVHLLGKG